jgi:hypothetical protein
VSSVFGLRLTINDRAKRAWAIANECEVELAEREGREPELLQPITLHGAAIPSHRC